MIEITAEIRAFIDKAAAGVELAEDEYIDPSDGLIHCKKCGGQRQTVVPCFGKSGYFMPHCICQCQREAEEQRKAAEERQRRMERIKRRKAQGLQDRYLYDYTSTIVPMCYIAPASRHGRLAFLRFWSQSAAVHRFSYDTAANFIFGRESHARS